MKTGKGHYLFLVDSSQKKKINQIKTIERGEIGFHRALSPMAINWASAHMKKKKMKSRRKWSLCEPTVERIRKKKGLFP